MVTIKEMVKAQFNYCNDIARDIIKNRKSKNVQKYAQGWAEIESALLDKDLDYLDWIRINWGDVYIFLHNDGTIDYQLDPLGEYGGEMIDVRTEEEFWEQLDKLTDEEIIENHYCRYDDYIEDCPSEYIPFS